MKEVIVNEKYVHSEQLVNWYYGQCARFLQKLSIKAVATSNKIKRLTQVVVVVVEGGEGAVGGAGWVLSL